MLSLFKQKQVFCAMPSHLPELRELAKQLPSWSRQWAGNGDRVVEVKVSCGKATCYGLHKTDKISTCICIAEAGTVMPKHAHGSDEYVIMIRGQAKVKMLGRIQIFGPKNFFVIPKGENHIVAFLSETEMQIVGIPAIDEFPGGGRFSYESEKYGIS